MSAVLPGSRSRAGQWARRAAYAVVLLGIGALAATAGRGLDLSDRARLVRYVGILIAAGLAVGAPHGLYPDPSAGRLQLSNPSPRRLLWHQVGRWALVLGALSVPALVVALGGPIREGRLAAEGVVSVWGLGLYALARVAALGPRIRTWESGVAGAWYRSLTTRAPALRFLVPDPLVPGLLLTGEVLLVGSAVAIAGQASGALGLAAAVALAAFAVGLLRRQSDGFDRAFWTTNGVWADAFRQSAGPAAGREPLTYGAVYWSPRAVRPAVWAGLVSLDRRVPLGRVAAAGLALVVAVHAAGASAGLRVATLALWTVGINAAVAFTASDALVPGALATRLHGATGWTLARFLMNVRWLPPLAGTLALLAWVMESVTVRDLAAWTLVDLAVAALSALFVTLFAQTRLRRAVA